MAVAVALALSATTGTAWASSPTTTASPSPGAAAKTAANTAVGPSKATGPSGPAAPSTANAAAESSAAARARATGKAVQVDAETTETTQVLAEPNGTFAFTTDTEPVRVKRNGAWTTIDTTLRQNTDGTWSAAATSDPVAFSGGGKGALVTLTDPKSSKTVTVSWPGSLPAPTVSGSAATYPGVLPGVDLRMKATATGYTEVLIVHDAAAAADPRLKTLTFAVHGGSGVRLGATSDGTLDAADSVSGSPMFTGGTATMWDSSATRHFAITPSADQAGSGRVTQIAMSSRNTSGSDATLTLSPPSGALTGPGLVFPLFIDPQLNGGRQYYAEVANFGGVWNTTKNNTSVGSGITEVGYCGYSSCYYSWNGNSYYSYTNRDYFQMDTSPLAHRSGQQATVYSATFNAYETGNSNGCTSQPVALWSAGPIGSGTTWPGPYGGFLSQASSAAGGGSSCPAANVALNAVSFARSAASAGYTNLTFELRAPDEGNDYQYKTFSDNASLTVYYNFAPFTPTGLSLGHQVTCTSTTYTSDLEPTLYATGTDNNPSPLNLNLWFEAWTANGGTRLSWNTSGVQIASGSRGQWTTNMGGGFSGQFEFRAQDSNIMPANDQASPLYSSWSGWFPFTDLPNAPTAAPSISSYDYPAGQWGQAAGAPGVFTVDPNGASNIAGFAYSVDGGAASEPVPATTDCGYLSDGGLGTSTTANGVTTGELQLVTGGSAQIRVPSGLSSGKHTLYVRSFDHAHNASAESTYVFYVAPNYQTASQPVTAVNGDTLAATATGTNASLVGTQTNNCCGVTWRDGNQLFFNNTASGGTFTVGFSVPDAGTWQLGADMTTATDYAQLRVDLDGTTNLGDTSGSAFDGYSPIVSLKYLDLGTQTLTAGSHTLTFTATGKNSSSTSYRAGVNYLELNPTNRYQAVSLAHSTPTAGTLGTQTWGTPLWSDNQQLMLSNSTAGANYTVTFNAPVESDYALGVHLTEANDYGALRFDLDPSGSNTNLDNTATTPIDAYNSTVAAKYIFLGGVHLTAGSHVLKITVVSTNGASVNNKYNAGFDYIVAAPVTGATEASLTAAMNNLGIANDGVATTASFDENNNANGIPYNLSLTALKAAGITPGTGTAAGSTLTLGGATFTMPQLKTDASGNVTADNVIADGQTIPLPNVKATGVSLLIANTCGASPAANVTLGYTGGGQSSQPALPAIPDWFSFSPIATVTLGHYDAGSTATSTVQPTLFAVTVPANPNYALSSITLPLLTDSFLPSTCPQALHVLALGTRTVATPPSGVWVGAYAAPMDTAITPAGGGMSDMTLREEITPSVTGSGSVRIHLSNAYSRAPVAFDAATIAAQSTNQATLAAPVALKFGGQTGVTIPAGGDAYSDDVALPSLTGGTGNLTVSLHIASATTVTLASIHDTDTAVTNYASGNQTANSDGTAFTSANSLTGLYYLAGVDVSDATTTDGTVAILGDQTATASPAWTTNTWGAALPSALSANSVALPGGIANTSTSGTDATDWWRLGEGGGTTAYDSRGTHNATLTGATWSTDGSNAPSLNGTTAYAATSGPVLNTTGSFTVSAWVKLSSTAHNAVAVAQDGANNSGFYLGYNTVNGGSWALYFLTSDTVNSGWQPDVFASGATAGTWTHLVGVYDATAKTARLYVNGALAGTATGVTTWSATGNFTIGRDKYYGNQADYFPGQISDVRAWNSPLVGTHVSEVYNDHGASTLTTADALAAFDQNAAAEPNLRDVIVSLGANDVLGGASAAGIESNLTALIGNLRGRYVNDEGNTSVQVFLTTIAPLGLPTSDGRETVRQAVNTWIMKNTTANLSIDTATAVADPANINQTAPTYLSGGVPLPAYYTQIANTIAAALAAIPPTPLVVKRG